MLSVDFSSVNERTCSGADKPDVVGWSRAAGQIWIYPRNHNRFWQLSILYVVLVIFCGDWTGFASNQAVKQVKLTTQPGGDDESTDFETFVPGGGMCILGRNMTYVRRKANALCLHATSYTHSLTTQHCPCTEEDWWGDVAVFLNCFQYSILSLFFFPPFKIHILYSRECDVDYARIGGEGPCVGPPANLTAPDTCEPNKTYLVSKGCALWGFVVLHPLSQWRQSLLDYAYGLGTEGLQATRVSLTTALWTTVIWWAERGSLAFGGLRDDLCQLNHFFQWSLIPILLTTLDAAMPWRWLPILLILCLPDAADLGHGDDGTCWWRLLPLALDKWLCEAPNNGCRPLVGRCNVWGGGALCLLQIP